MPDPTELFILLGANLGNRTKTFAQARTQLTERVGLITNSSRLYESVAWGVDNQPSYLNQVLQLTTALSPDAVLAQTQAIEIELGRVRLEKWGSRLIDIDLLFFGDLIWQTDTLTMPHPLLHLRRFTLRPLAEIAPDFQHPAFGKTIQDLLANCPDLVEPTQVLVL